MKNCEKIRQNFSGYLEGELSPEKKAHIEKHLNNCPHTVCECQETLNRIRYLQETLQNLPRVSTNSNFEHKLHQRIRAISKPARHRFSFRQGDWKFPALATLSIMFIVGLLILFIPQKVQTGRPASGTPGLTPSISASGPENGSSQPNSPSQHFSIPASRHIQTRDSLNQQSNKPEIDRIQEIPQPINKR